MSFWSLRSRAIQASNQWIGALGTCLAVAAASSSASAQEYYVQPRADVGVEADTNRDLSDTSPKRASEGNLVDAGATVGIATPESDTTLRPQIDYYNFPNLSESALEGRLDFASNFNSQRFHSALGGVFDHRELFGSELASADFNIVNPNLPTTPETGRISVTGARTLLTAAPNFSYDLTQRLSLQLTGVYQNVGYSGVENTSAYIAYGYYDATAGVDWKLSPRSDVSVGVDGSEESAKDVYSVTKGHGIVVTYNYQWSKVFTGSLSVLGEQYDIYGLPPNTTVPVSPRSTSSGVGASYQTTWKGQISQLQLTVGRTFTPNGAGGSYTSDQFQFEYRRQLSPRLSFDGAAHYIQNDALSREYDAGNYDYLIATADLKWNLTRTWFVGGGLQYLETKSPVAGTSANDSMLHVGFGYEGLGRQY